MCQHKLSLISSQTSIAGDYDGLISRNFSQTFCDFILRDIVPATWKLFSESRTHCFGTGIKQIKVFLLPVCPSRIEFFKRHGLIAAGKHVVCRVAKCVDNVHGRSKGRRIQHFQVGYLFNIHLMRK